MSTSETHLHSSPEGDHLPLWSQRVDRRKVLKCPIKGTILLLPKLIRIDRNTLTHPDNNEEAEEIIWETVEAIDKQPIKIKGKECFLYTLLAEDLRPHWLGTGWLERWMEEIFTPKELRPYWEALAFFSYALAPKPPSTGPLPLSVKSLSQGGKDLIRPEDLPSYSALEGVSWKTLLFLLQTAARADLIQRFAPTLTDILDHYRIPPDNAIFVPSSETLPPSQQDLLLTWGELGKYMVSLASLKKPTVNFFDRAKKLLVQRGQKEWLMDLPDNTTTILQQKSFEFRLFFVPDGRKPLGGEYMWGYKYEDDGKKYVILLDLRKKKVRKRKLVEGKSWLTDVTEKINELAKSGVEFSQLGMLLPSEFLNLLIVKSYLSFQKEVSGEDLSALFLPLDPALRSELAKEAIKMIMNGEVKTKQWGVVTKEIQVYKLTARSEQLLGISVGGKKITRLTPTSAKLHPGDFLMIKDIYSSKKGDWVVISTQRKNDGGTTFLVVPLAELTNGGALVLSNKTMWEEIWLAIKILGPFVAVATADEIMGGGVVKTATRPLGKGLIWLIKQFLKASYRR